MLTSKQCIWWFRPTLSDFTCISVSVRKAAIAMIGLACFGWFVLVNVGNVVAMPDEENPKSVRLILDAFKASVESVQSGHGTGAYQVMEVTDNGDSKLLEEAAVDVWFDRNKYLLELNYKGTPKPQLGKKRIICDGVSIIHSEFWQGVPHPTGAVGFLESTERDVRQPGDGLFLWDMSCLPKQVFNAEAFFSKKPPHKVFWVQDGVVLRGKCDITENIGFEFAASEEFGFNAFEMKGINKGDNELAKYINARWKLIDGHWCIDKIVQRLKSKVWAFTYKTFTPNVSVSTEKFSIDALELPENSRIIDQRANITPRSFYYVRRNNNNTQGKVESLVKQVSELPTMRKPAQPE